VQSCSSGTPARASSICSPQPVQVTFPQDEHETGEHILISYISSSLPGDEWGPGGYLEFQYQLKFLNQNIESISASDTNNAGGPIAATLDPRLHC
jgi:hypothetical protein